MTEMDTTENQSWFSKVIAWCLGLHK